MLPAPAEHPSAPGSRSLLPAGKSDSEEMDAGVKVPLGVCVCAQGQGARRRRRRRKALRVDTQGSQSSRG